VTSALFAGTLLGLASSVTGRISPRLTAIVIGALGVLLSARDVGVLHFPIPQLRRQTNPVWRHRFGPTWAAWLWGLDLGSGLTTLVSYAAYWLLPIAVILRGEVWYGAGVFGLFGFGRALWTVAAALNLRASEGFHAGHLLQLWQHGAVIRRTHAASAVGLCLLIGGLALVYG